MHINNTRERYYSHSCCHFFNVILSRLKRLVGTSVKVLCARCVRWTKPLSSSLPLGTLAGLGRSKSELIAENALLRQQLIMLKRQVKRPVCTKTDRILLMLLARVVRAWKQALLIVQPETLLRWRREAFHLYRKHVILPMVLQKNFTESRNSPLIRDEIFQRFVVQT